MALSRQHQGSVPVANPRPSPAWDPSAPSSDALFSDLSPLPGQTQQHQTGTFSRGPPLAQVPLRSAYVYPDSQTPVRNQAAVSSSTPPSQPADTDQPRGLPMPHAGQHDTFRPTEASAMPMTAEERERQHMMQQDQQHQDSQSTSMSAEERELQYMQQQQQQQQQQQHQQQPFLQGNDTQVQTDGLPAEFRLPASTGNPFETQALPSEHRPELSNSSVAGAQALTGDQHHQRQNSHLHHHSSHHAENLAAGPQQQPGPRQPAGGFFPTVDYDWASPASDQQKPSGMQQQYTHMGGPNPAGFGPSWPPPAFQGGPGPNGYIPGGNFGPPGPPGPGFPGPYGPPGFGHPGPPPPMYYPPPPPPIVYVDDPYYYDHHNRNVGLAAGGIGGLALGALLF